MWCETHLVGLQGLALHIEVPDFGGQVVSGEQVATAVAELDVGHGRDDLWEEGTGAGVLGLLEHWGGTGGNKEREKGRGELLLRQMTHSWMGVSLCHLEK